MIKLAFTGERWEKGHSQEWIALPLLRWREGQAARGLDTGDAVY
jgi:hypothetical protein